MTFMAKNMASLDDGGKSLYSFMLWRDVCVSCKSLIDMMLEQSCILMAGIELYKYA